MELAPSLLPPAIRRGSQLAVQCFKSAPRSRRQDRSGACDLTYAHCIAGVPGLGRNALIIGAEGWIGPNCEKASAHGDALMAGIGWEDNDIACAELERTAVLSAEAHFGAAARDPHHFMDP
jgi:hypothetical protein